MTDNIPAAVKLTGNEAFDIIQRQVNEIEELKAENERLKNPSDKQIQKFLSVGFRHMHIKGDISFSEIRQGFDFMRKVNE